MLRWPGSLGRTFSAAWFALWLAAAHLALPAGAAGDEPLLSGRLSPEIQAALRPGLTLRLVANDFSQPALDALPVSFAAWYAPAGGYASVRLPDERYMVRLSGFLKIPLRSEATFLIEGNGQAELLVNDRPVVVWNGNQLTYPSGELTQLAKGYNHLELRYTPAAAGDAQVRVLWRGEKWAAEPLPSEQLFARRDEPDLVAANQVRQGRELFASRHCARCHEVPNAEHAEKLRMPDLGHEGPSLARAGERFRTEWLVAWMLDPPALAPHASMPRLFEPGNPAAAATARDIGAYLAALGKSPAEPGNTANGPAAGAEEAAAARANTSPPAEKAHDVAAGEILFENLGCLGCHRLNEPGEYDRYARTTLWLAGAKYRPEGLVEFLRAPRAHQEWRRMPDFRLTLPEASQLAAYILSHAQGTLAPAVAESTQKEESDAPAGDAARGAKAFVSVGCAPCHTTGEPLAPLAKRAFPSPDTWQGCLARTAAERGQAPHFGFSETQRGALAAVLREVSCLGRETPAEFARRQFALLRCATCHGRHGDVPDLPIILAEEGSQGSAPEIFPSLTWVGEKLRTAAIHQFLAGTPEPRTRYWLKGRMPSFGPRAATLALGLAHEQGFGPHEHARPHFNQALANVGAVLLEKQGGFNCVMCHAVQDRPAVAPFEAPGINLADAAGRLRYSYFRRWLLDPLRVDPLTKMPRFSPDGKTTGLPEILEGDASRQFEALWHHISTLEAAPRQGPDPPLSK